jgi:hypothetical protein
MVTQANEANTATDETPATAALLRALRLAFFGMEECNQNNVSVGETPLHDKGCFQEWLWR